MEKTFGSSVLSEEEIIEKIVAGEKVLFEILIRRYNPVLYKIARCYGFNHQDAEDLMQEAHVSAYLNLKNFQHKASYKTWISKILIHKCVYKLSYGYFKNEHPDSNSMHENAKPVFNQPKMATEKIVLNKELSKVLEKSLQKIPLTYRTVFILREIEGFNTAETAELINTTSVNVKVRLSRAKALLQKKLENHYTSTDIFEFNAVYCDSMVKKVFEQIDGDFKEF
jgi:RNA polymerase sigma factor (sigma-70 family)